MINEPLQIFVYRNLYRFAEKEKGKQDVEKKSSPICDSGRSMHIIRL